MSGLSQRFPKLRLLRILKNRTAQDGSEFTAEYGKVASGRCSVNFVFQTAAGNPDGLCYSKVREESVFGSVNRLVAAKIVLRSQLIPRLAAIGKWNRPLI